MISDVGVALAIPTEGASLSLVPVGEGMSAIGKGMKASVHLSNGNVKGAIREGVNAAVGAVTNSGTQAAINSSRKVSTITTNGQEVINKVALGVSSSATNKTASLATEVIKDRDERQ